MHTRSLLTDVEVAGIPGMPSVHTLRAARRRARFRRLNVPPHIRLGNGKGLVRYPVFDVLCFAERRGISAWEAVQYLPAHITWGEDWL